MYLHQYRHCESTPKSFGILVMISFNHTAFENCYSRSSQTKLITQREEKGKKGNYLSVRSGASTHLTLLVFGFLVVCFLFFVPLPLQVGISCFSDVR